MIENNEKYYSKKIIIIWNWDRPSKDVEEFFFGQKTIKVKIDEFTFSLSNGKESKPLLGSISSLAKYFDKAIEYLIEFYSDGKIVLTIIFRYKKKFKRVSTDFHSMPSFLKKHEYIDLTTTIKKAEKCSPHFSNLTVRSRKPFFIHEIFKTRKSILNAA